MEIVATICIVLLICFPLILCFRLLCDQQLFGPKYAILYGIRQNNKTARAEQYLIDAMTSIINKDYKIYMDTYCYYVTNEKDDIYIIWKGSRSQFYSYSATGQFADEMPTRRTTLKFFNLIKKLENEIKPTKYLCLAKNNNSNIPELLRYDKCYGLPTHGITYV